MNVQRSPLAGLKMKRSFEGFGGSDFAEPDPAQRNDQTDPEPAAKSSTGQRRYALLIGNGKYRQDKLRNPVPDVRLVGEAFKQLGFKVTVIEDGDLAVMRSAVGEFAVALNETDPDSVAIVYFAGHGIQWEGINYLVPSNADIPHRHYLPARALALDEVAAGLSTRQRDANVIILDACRNNPLPDGQLDEDIGTASVTGGLAALSMTPAGMLIAYSTAANDVAYDGDADNSPYAKALTEVLPQLLEPGRRIHEIFIETAEAVRDATGGKQSPALYLQGGLPPLTLGPKDAVRRRDYDPWRPVRVGKIVVSTFLVLAMILLIALAIGVWNYEPPEIRQDILARIGVGVSPSEGLSCDGPLDSQFKDIYGLTHRDWCTLLPRDLQLRAERVPNYSKIISEERAKGDAKALFLFAHQVYWSAAGALSQDQRDGMDDELYRSVNTGLPVAAYFADILAQGGVITQEYQLLLHAPVAGHVLSQVRLAVDTMNDKTNFDQLVRHLQALDSADPTGYAADQLARLFDGTLRMAAPVNLEQMTAYALEAARKGYPEAIGNVFRMEKRGLVTISPVDREAFRARQFQLNDPDGIRWRIEQLEEGTDGNGQIELSALLRRLVYQFGDGTAAYKLVSRDLTGTGGLPIDANDAQAVLGFALERTRNPDLFIMRAKMAMGEFFNLDGYPLFPIDPKAALRDLDSASRGGQNFRAFYETAIYYLRGIDGQPDLRAAAALLDRLKGKQDNYFGDNPAILRRTIDISDQVSADTEPWDIEYGRKDAPITVTAYVDPNCVACGSPERGATLRTLLDTYVEAGFTRLVVRPVGSDPAGLSALAELACEDNGSRAATVKEELGTGQIASRQANPCDRAADSSNIANANLVRERLVQNLGLMDQLPYAPDQMPYTAHVPAVAWPPRADANISLPCHSQWVDVVQYNARGNGRDRLSLDDARGACEPAGR
jgi:hypothetical protein